MNEGIKQAVNRLLKEREEARRVAYEEAKNGR
jgi:hypothetical protein